MPEQHNDAAGNSRSRLNFEHDLSASEVKTYARVQKFMQNVSAGLDSRTLNNGREWDDGPRHPMHLAVKEDVVKNFEGVRTTSKPVAIFTAGPSGVANSDAVQSGLQMLSDTNSPLGQSLNDLMENPRNHVTADTFVVLNHQMIKEAIWRRGGLDYAKEKLPERIREEYSPAEISAGIHVESSWVMERVAEEAMSRGHNIIYEISMQNPDPVRALLENFKEKGYERIAVSVEEPLPVALRKNAENWAEGRKDFQQKSASGEQVFGRVMTPPGLIEAAYLQSPERSVCRQHADHFAREGLINAIVEVDPQATQVLDRASLDRRWELQSTQEHLAASQADAAARRQMDRNMTTLIEGGDDRERLPTYEEAVTTSLASHQQLPISSAPGLHQVAAMRPGGHSPSPAGSDAERRTPTPGVPAPHRSRPSTPENRPPSRPRSR